MYNYRKAKAVVIVQAAPLPWRHLCISFQKWYVNELLCLMPARTSLSRLRFSTHISTLLHYCGLNSHCYSGHSFHVCAGTIVAQHAFSPIHPWSLSSICTREYFFFDVNHHIQLFVLVFCGVP